MHLGVLDTRATPDDLEVHAPVRRSLVAVASAVVLIVIANRWGFRLLDDGVRIRILAPPLVGRFQLGPDRGWDAFALAPFATAALLVSCAPRLASTLPWRRLLLAAGVGAALWAVGLALASGWYWLQRPMELPGHYLHDVGAVGNPFTFLRSFTDDLGGYATHVRAHPPGFLLTLWGLDRLGFAGSGWATLLVVAGGASAAPAVLVAVRELAGEAQARRAAPFVVISPLALYVATTPDAFYMGVGAWAVTCIVLATGREGSAGTRLAVAGGALFGATLLLSYGLVLLAAIPLAVAWWRGTWRPLWVAAMSGAAVLGLFALLGFWWVEGLFATRLEYLDSVASVRPYWYFLVANVAALAVVIGPATVAGLAHTQVRPLAVLFGGAIAAIALADLSGMSKGEVERIWLPFAIWLLPAAAVLVARETRHLTTWLSAQASVAIGVQLLVRTHW
ncbi:MAG TPA: hypothetical protein VFZ83_02410 [Acidimicrobiia bacterium]|nr:hypothetical protein [Acidimicrobiia bacterium]